MENEKLQGGNDTQKIENDAGGNSGADGKDGKLSYEELEALYNRSKADSDRYKSALDKKTKENGELTKKVRENMSAQDIAKADMDALQEELKTLKAEKAMAEAVGFYTSSGIGMDREMALEIAQAEADGDVKARNEVLIKYIKKVKEDSRNQFLDSRKDVNTGNGNGGKSTVAEDIAKNLAKNKTGGVNQDILKNYF